MTEAAKHCGTCYLRDHDVLPPDDGHGFVTTFETSGEDSVFCPWCGHDNGTDEMEDGQRIDCSECEREFSVEVEYYPRYSTSKEKCYACRAVVEHPLHIKLSSIEGACSEAHRIACDDAYAEYIAAYQANKGRGVSLPSRGFLVEAKDGAA